jgi:formyl-CoA transferase
VTSPEGDLVVLDGVPVRLSRTPGYVAAPGPLLGEHTDAVLRDVLGLDAAEVRRLREAGVVS